MFKTWPKSDSAEKNFANTVMERILSTKYTVPSSVAGGNKSEYLAIFDICENALSFTTRVMTKNGKAYKIGLSPSRYLDFQAGKKIELTVEDLHTAFRRISDVLIERLDNPDTGMQTVIVGHADKLSIECATVNSELRLSLSPPNDIKILCRDICKQSGASHFRAREDVSVTVINSEIAKFMLSLDQAIEFCKFLDIIQNLRTQTYSNLKDHYSDDPSRYP